MPVDSARKSSHWTGRPPKCRRAPPSTAHSFKVVGGSDMRNTELLKLLTTHGSVYGLDFGQLAVWLQFTIMIDLSKEDDAHSQICSPNGRSAMLQKYY